jgi:hypothetical protein
VLVIADPAPGPGHLQNAEREGRDVARLFEEFDRLARPESGAGAVVTRLFGPDNATRCNVMLPLLTAGFDVLHYAGHAFFDPANPPGSGWIFRLGDSKRGPEVLSSRELRRLDRLPPFVFSNACESGVTPNFPERRSDRFAPSFAEAFFDRGVANFICTAWPVLDQPARKFARTFYARLLGLKIEEQGDTFRVVGMDTPRCLHEAMRDARQAVKADRAGLRTWGAYQHYGNPFSQLFPRELWPKPGPDAASQGGPLGGSGTNGGVNTGSSPPPSMAPTPRPAATGGSADPFAEVRAAIEAGGDALRDIPGVVDVRPGFKYTGGWTTGRPAVVVVVREKPERGAVSAGDRIPKMIGGVPTDVAPATPRQQLPRAETRGAGDEAEEAISPLDDLIAPGEEPVVIPDDEGVARALVQYRPPDGVPLKVVRDMMTVTCHLSPDSGWPTLAGFLGEVRGSLTMAMYDFSSPHVVEELQQSLSVVPRTLELVLDPALSLTNGGGKDNPKEHDLKEADIVEGLRQTLGPDRFQFTWAAVKRKGKVSEGIFPRSYHIKVAVRDDEAFWLSSGNWQSSNQPPLDVVPADPKAEIDGPAIWRKYNREWHVIVEHPGLAETFRAYIDSDFQQAELLQAGERGEAPEAPRAWLLVPVDEEVERRPRQVTRFDPLIVKDRPVKVLPVLTPDNYAEHVLPLIEGATASLYFQNQYIAIGKEIPQAFDELLRALLERSRALGDGFRMILRDIADTRAMLEVLEGRGFDVARQVKV